MLTPYPTPAMIPDGNYDVKILHLNIGNAKSTGRPRIHYVLEIQEGALKGQHINKIHMLTTEAAVKQCLKEWSRAGVKVRSPAELASHLDSIGSAHYRVTVVNGQNSCCYFQERIERGGDAAASQMPSSSPSPFSADYRPKPVVGANTTFLGCTS